METGTRIGLIARAAAVALGLAVVAVTVFHVPVSTIASLAIFAICPLMMLGMHGSGHGREPGAKGGACCGNHGRDGSEEHDPHHDSRRDP